METVTKQDAKDIAETMLQQLGGHRKLQAMIGAKKFSFNAEGALTFSFALCKQANAVRIELDWTDTYNVVFIQATLKGGYREVETIDQVHADQLKSVFEEYTGLRLSLF